MGDDSAPPLNLTAEQAAASPRAHYAAKLADYVPIYRRQLRVIKRWIEKGRAANPPELPPLDDPEAMLAWWPRNMEWKVPDDLLAAASAAKARRDPPASTPPAASAPAVTDSAPAKIPATPLAAGASTTTTPRTSMLLDDGTEAMTLAEAMPRLQRVLGHALRDYEAKAGDPNADEASVTLAANRLDRVIERHRKLETTLIESAQKRGELVSVLELRPQLGAIFARLSGNLVEHLMLTHGLDRATAVASVDTWYSQVRGLPFGDLAQLSPEARAA
jgi:hypothetical protein